MRFDAHLKDAMMMVNSRLHGSTRPDPHAAWPKRCAAAARRASRQIALLLPLVVLLVAYVLVMLAPVQPASVRGVSTVAPSGGSERIAPQAPLPLTDNGPAAAQRAAPQPAIATPGGDYDHFDNTTSPSAARVPGKQRVVYVLDASGSLIDCLADAVAWLREDLYALDAEDAFTVLVLHDGGLLEVPAPGLKQATFLTKSRVCDWLAPHGEHVYPAGRGGMLIEAVRAALAYRPQRMVLISDDGFGERLNDPADPGTVERIATLLDAQQVRLDTVQIYYRDQAGLLEALADRCGGRYAFVHQDDDAPSYLVDLNRQITFLP